MYSRQSVPYLPLNLISESRYKQELRWVSEGSAEDHCYLKTVTDSHSQNCTSIDHYAPYWPIRYLLDCRSASLKVAVKQNVYIMHKTCCSV